MLNSFPLFFKFSIIFFLSQTFAQSNVSGVINDYSAVNSIDLSNNIISISSSTAFNSGDKILIIQMQGATINENQSSAFGTIDNYNEAGSYEIQTICDIIGNDIITNTTLIYNYDYLFIICML